MTRAPRRQLPAPAENLEDVLMWSTAHGMPERVRLVLAHGVDPDGRGTQHPVLAGRSRAPAARSGAATR